MMWSGVAYALAAGLMWGLVFVGPVLLPDYPPVMQSFGRYLAFGLIALPLSWLDRSALKRLSRSDWIEALKLAAIGNLIYYLFLATAIQRTGGPLATTIIGTLPVVIAITSNQRDYRRDGRLPWLQLLPSLLLIGAGIACVNAVELAGLAGEASGSRTRYLSGALFGIGALICWTWYPLRNADWLRNHPGRSPRVWATAQGLATFPMALVGYLGLWLWTSAQNAELAMPFGPRPQVFVGLMFAIGLLSSWLGTRCWNEASQRLPTALLGQLIVFETLAALAYTFLWRGQWPAPTLLVGIGLLVLGVIWATRVKPIPIVPIRPAAATTARRATKENA